MPERSPSEATQLELDTAVPYTTTEPTFTPPVNGIRRHYNDSTRNWLYAFFNSGWKKIVFDGIQKVVAGTGITLSPSSGVGDVTITANVSQQLKDFTMVDTLVAGDVASLLEAGTDVTVLLQDLGEADRAFGDGATNEKLACSFVAPISATAIKISIDLKRNNAPADDVYLRVYSSSGGSPNASLASATIANADTSTSYATFNKSLTVTLVAGTTYWIVLERSGATDATNYWVTKVNDGWSIYYAAKILASGSWSASTFVLYFTLTSNITAGLYKTLDTPNAINLQGSCQGIVNSVSGSTATLVVGGYYTHGSAVYTAGQTYFMSTSSAGSVATTGNCDLGYAVSTTIIYVLPVKKCRKFFRGAVFTFVTSPATLTIMLGFLAKTAHFQAIGETYSSLGLQQGTVANSMKISQATNPAIAAIAWDTDNSGGGTIGSAATSVTFNKSTVTVVASAQAATKRYAGVILFES